MKHENLVDLIYRYFIQKCIKNNLEEDIHVQ